MCMAMCREVADYMLEKEGQGATCVLVAIAQSVVGAFAIKDPLKPEVRFPNLAMQSIYGVTAVPIRARFCHALCHVL